MQDKTYKIVFKDGDTLKAITSEILNEDEHFITIHALKTNTEMRIGKAFVVSIKPLSNGGGYNG